MKEFQESRRQQPDEAGKERYNRYVKDVTPTHSLPAQMAKAFMTGGLICCLGQGILNCALRAGLDSKTAGSWCSLGLVVLSAVLTGLNIFPAIAKWGGAGATVPLTGFGYSLASGVKKAVAEQGWLGVMTGGLSATAGGIAAAVCFAVVMALLFRPGDKR